LQIEKDGVLSTTLGKSPGSIGNLKGRKTLWSEAGGAKAWGIVEKKSGGTEGRQYFKVLLSYIKKGGEELLLL